MNFKRFRRDADLEDELRVHLEMQAEENADRGMPPVEARRRAHLRLGRTPAIIERIRDQEALVMLEGWYRDFLFGMRAIRQSPVFCITAILTLALGIGANTAIFALLYGLLLRSLPVAHPEQLAHIRIVSAASQSNDTGSFIPYRMIEQFEREQHSFSGISLWRLAEVTMLDREGSLRTYNAELVSGNAFPLLGLNPYLGRLISPRDDVRGGPPRGWPVVLSYGFWTEHFGADRRHCWKTDHSLKHTHDRRRRCAACFSRHPARHQYRTLPAARLRDSSFQAPDRLPGMDIRVFRHRSPERRDASRRGRK